MLEKDLNNQEKLEAVYKMTLENNDILRTIRRQQYFANALRVFYWLVVLGALGSTYYFVKPLMNSFTSNGSPKLDDTMSQFNQLRDQLPEAKMINQVLGGLGIKRGTSSDIQMPDNGVVDASTTQAQ